MKLTKTMMVLGALVLVGQAPLALAQKCDDEKQVCRDKSGPNVEMTRQRYGDQAAQRVQRRSSNNDGNQRPDRPDRPDRPPDPTDPPRTPCVRVFRRHGNGTRGRWVGGSCSASRARVQWATRAVTSTFEASAEDSMARSST